MRSAAQLDSLSANVRIWDESDDAAFLLHNSQVLDYPYSRSISLPEKLSGHEAVLPRFNRLFRALLRNEIKQNIFLPWEIALLTDIRSCPQSRYKKTLEHYRLAVQRQLREEGGSPILFSEYLRRRLEKNGRS